MEAAQQIRSRERVRGLAEVYTDEREVTAMLDLVGDMFPSAEEPGNTDRTFLEPACGHGNFLVEILGRKLEFVTPRRYGRGERFEHRVLRCLASIYGIDICEDNVYESRERMEQAIHAHLAKHLGAKGPTVGFLGALGVILETNVVCADSLLDTATIELVEYRPERWCTFVREWSHLESGGSTLSPLVRRRDTAPLHYSELSANPGPVAAEAAEREAA
ncbi:MAG TPA: hypothetical protein VF255_03630 [Solirubrobacterales bacterium]